jgi:hypothetical protein
MGNHAVDHDNDEKSFSINGMWRREADEVLTAVPGTIQ